MNDAKKTEIRRQHAEQAAHGAGVINRPQGPCICDICLEPAPPKFRPLIRRCDICDRATMLPTGRCLWHSI